MAVSYDFFNKWAPIFMDYLIHDFGLTLEDAAAVVGNAGHESGGFKSLQEIKPVVPGSRGGFGIMQWTGPRRRAFEEYGKRHDYDIRDMEVNYKFLFVELQGPEGKVLPELKVAKGLNDKVEVFMKKFLRPGVPHLDSRIIWAKRALEAYANQPKKETEMGSLTKILSGLFSENSKAWGASIGALLAQAVDPTILGPVVSDPAFQTAIVNIIGAALGAWFASPNKSKK